MPDDSPIEERTLDLLLQFARRNWLRILGISAVLLVPCFWHRHIEASDLGSHLYNAWLAQLIHRGQAPGLWLAPQRTNVLFDFLLSGFGSLFGLHAAERIAVSLSILIFFWGAFSLAAAAARRAPWFLAPLIAMVAFGYTYHMGFFNFYLSLGLSFFGLAILWYGRGSERLAALAFVPLVALAHPLGLIWFVTAGAYIALAQKISVRLHAILFAAAVAAFVAAYFYFTSHYITEPPPVPGYTFNGTDQLLLFGGRYGNLALTVVVFGLAAIAGDLLRHPGERLRALVGIPLELYLLTLVAVPLLPRGITFGPHVAPIALLTDRMTSVSAVVGICLLANLRPRKWHMAASLAIAAVFFSFIYQDTSKADRMETQAEHLVRLLPPNRRVLATIKSFPGSRVLIQHMIDRACIAYCFTYGNYEPPSNVFRVRALPGNPYVLTDYDTAVSTENGDYEVQPEDLPIYQVYQCSPDGLQLCIEPLQAGQPNDRDGIHPPDE